MRLKSTGRTPTRSGERQKYSRFTFICPIRILELGQHPENKSSGSRRFYAARTKNISQGGIKITLLPSLEPGSTVLIEADLAQFAKHIDTQNLLRISENRLMAKVIWRHLNLETGLFEAGLQFLEEKERAEYESRINEASQTSG